MLALASRIAAPYYFGNGMATTHYGLTMQHRNVIQLVTPVRVHARSLLDGEICIVNPVRRKFFGFGPVDVLGYKVMIFDREQTAIDCINRPSLSGGEGEAAAILAMACRNIDWREAASYLERIGSRNLIRRFGWLADHAGAEFPGETRVNLR